MNPQPRQVEVGSPTSEFANKVYKEVLKTHPEADAERCKEDSVPPNFYVPGISTMSRGESFDTVGKLAMESQELAREQEERRGEYAAGEGRYKVDKPRSGVQFAGIPEMAYSRIFGR